MVNVVVDQTSNDAQPEPSRPSAVGAMSVEGSNWIGSLNGACQHLGLNSLLQVVIGVLFILVLALVRLLSERPWRSWKEQPMNAGKHNNSGNNDETPPRSATTDTTYWRPSGRSSREYRQDAGFLSQRTLSSARRSVSYQFALSGRRGRRAARRQGPLIRGRAIPLRSRR